MTAVAIAATPSRVRTGWILPALVILVVTAVARWAAAPYTVGVFHDDGIYALLARSIASGEGFHHSHLAGAPAATHYPPLYPLLLAVAWRMSPTFPENIAFLLGINTLLLGVAALGFWRFARARLAWTPGVAVAGTVAALLASPVLALAGSLLSETLFIAMLFPALLLSERAADSDGLQSSVGAGAIIGALMLVRTHAFALVLACTLVVAARRRWRNAGALVGAALVVQLPWLVWSHWASPRVPAPLEGSYGSYIGWFIAGVREGGLGLVLATARTNAAECWLLLQDRLASGLPAPVHYLMLAVVIAALVHGASSLALRAPVTLVFTALYFAIVLVWPYSPWRFVWAMWPFIALLAFEGVRAMYVRAGRWRMAVAVGAALPALAFVRTELHAYATRSWRTPSRQASVQIAPVLGWVRAHTTEGDALLSEGEQVIALYTGRKAAPPIDFTAREYLAPPDVAEGTTRLQATLRVLPARYVILLAPNMVRSADALADARPGLRRIDALSGGAVYEVVP